MADDDSLYLMSPMEIAWGHIRGHVGQFPPSPGPRTNAREALERVVRDALLRPPCGVAFSGGRDSSLVLAVAAHVARRDGLREPVPITRVFPEVADAAEQDWQDAVIRHLRLRDWHRVVIHDELDVVGPLAAAHLLEHGVVWPPTIAGDVPLVEAVPGGTVIDGEGGDEVLGVGAHRTAPLHRLVRRPLPLRWRRIRSALGSLAPPGVRGRHERRRASKLPLTWLRPAASEPLLLAVERTEAERPLAFAASVRMVPLRRTQVLGGRNRRILAKGRGVQFSSPLLHPDVVNALAREGGMLGKGDRTRVLRGMASDLLPEEVLARTHKAVFTRCYMGRPTREFAADWSGEGVDAELVDPQELRRLWLTESPPATTAALLQSAWLSTIGHG